MPQPSRKPFIILALALAIRLYFVFIPTFFPHEVPIIARSVLPLPDLLALPGHESLSSGFLLLIKAFMKMLTSLGDPSTIIQSLRLLSFLAGAATVILAIVAAQRWWGPRAAVFTAVLVGFHPPHILASSILSPHATLQLTTLAATLCLIRFASPNALSRKKNALLYLASLCVSVLISPMAWTMLFPHALAFIFMSRVFPAVSQYRLVGLICVSFFSMISFRYSPLRSALDALPRDAAFLPIWLLTMAGIGSLVCENTKFPRLAAASRHASNLLWLLPLLSIPFTLRWSTSRDSSTVFNALKPIEMPLTTDTIIWTNSRAAPWLSRARKFTLVSAGSALEKMQSTSQSFPPRPVWFISHRGTQSPEMLLPADDIKLIELLNTTPGVIESIIPARRREWSRVWVVPPEILPAIQSAVVRRDLPQ